MGCFYHLFLYFFGLQHSLDKNVSTMYLIVFLLKNARFITNKIENQETHFWPGKLNLGN